MFSKEEKEKWIRTRIKEIKILKKEVEYKKNKIEKLSGFKRTDFIEEIKTLEIEKEILEEYLVFKEIWRMSLKKKKIKKRKRNNVVEVLKNSLNKADEVNKKLLKEKMKLRRELMRRDNEKLSLEEAWKQ